MGKELKIDEAAKRIASKKKGDDPITNYTEIVDGLKIHGVLIAYQNDAFIVASDDGIRWKVDKGDIIKMIELEDLTTVIDGIQVVMVIKRGARIEETKTLILSDKVIRSIEEVNFSEPDNHAFNCMMPVTPTSSHVPNGPVIKRHGPPDCSSPDCPSRGPGIKSYDVD